MQLTTSWKVFLRLNTIVFWDIKTTWKFITSKDYIVWEIVYISENLLLIIVTILDLNRDISKYNT